MRQMNPLSKKPSFGSIFLSSLILIGVLPAIALGSPAPGEDTYKVVGRGMESRSTGERIQLACVGSILESGERSCDTLRLLYTDAGGNSKLVWSALHLNEDKRVKKQVALYLREAKISKQNPFGVVRHWYQEKLFGGLFSPSRNGTVPGAIFMSMLLLGTCVATGGGTCALAVGNLAVVAGFVLPVIGFDLLFFPAQRIATMGSARSVKALQDRSMPAWQLRPRKVSGRRFDKILAHLNIRASSETSQVALEVNPEQLADAVQAHSVLPTDSSNSDEFWSAETNARVDSQMETIEKNFSETGFSIP